MALTEIYVDPSLAADSGTGTIGDPFGDLEFAIEQSTFDTANGTRVNIKAGTDEVLAAGIQAAMADTGTTAAWVPSATAPLVFQGYTAVAGDGGVGGISGGGSVPIFNNGSQSFIHFIDLHCHNVGANIILTVSGDCSVIRCELNNGTSNGINISVNGIVSDCYIHNIGGIGIVATNCKVLNNYIKDGANLFTEGIYSNGTCTVYRNIIIIDAGSGRGIRVVSSGGLIINNSIYANGGTGAGIIADANARSTGILNNIIEGLSGAGGIGIDLDAANVVVIQYGGNSIYNCTTSTTAASVEEIDALGNETLSASAFKNAAVADFSPVNIGAVKEGSLPATIGGNLV